LLSDHLLQGDGYRTSRTIMKRAPGDGWAKSLLLLLLLLLLLHSRE
jgi:hypothetical protein